MSKFGWSLPPGCSTLPDEEAHAIDLSPYITNLPSGVNVFWDEDGQIIETRAVPDLDGTVTASDKVIGQIDWDDEHDAEQNYHIAAYKYTLLTTTLCWYCDEVFSKTDAACPRCGAANANVDLELANKQLYDEFPKSWPK
jgi:hypothetical protein